MTTPHPATVRRRARAAGEPPRPTGRKAGPEGPLVNLTVRVPPALRIYLADAATAAGTTVSAVALDILEKAREATARK